MEWLSASENDTEQIAAHIAHQLQDGDILLFQGPLGAGKTTLTKAIARCFGIKKNVTSPTFTLMNVYEIEDNGVKERKIEQLIHIDTYRLKNEHELIDIGVEDYLGMPGTVCIIEWPEKIPNILKNYSTKTVKIEHVDANTRKIGLNVK